MKSHWLLIVVIYTLISVLLPLAYFYIFDPQALEAINTRNTIIATVYSIFIGSFVTSKLDGFPGGQSGAHILTGYTLVFVLAMSTMFLLRFQYSTVMFISSYFISVSLFLSTYFLSQKHMRPQIALIEGGSASKLLSIEKVDWRVLERPSRLNVALEAIVADFKYEHNEEWERFMAEEVLEGIPVYHYKQVLENLTGKIEIEHLSENIMGSLIPNQLYFTIKKLIDWIAALFFLPVFAILFLVIGLLIKISSPGPVLYKQTRVGFRGERFEIYKFRTMHVANSERKSEKKREEYMTDEDDSRVFRFAHFMRRSRIDELPQVLNILRGEMSWIGPRPEAQSLSNWYEKEIPFYSYRHILKPGITGWAQVNQGHVAEPDQVKAKLHFDFYYIKYFSAWLDFLIVLKTLRTMLTGFGAR